jgi:hypothetical protein
MSRTREEEVKGDAGRTCDLTSGLRPFGFYLSHPRSRDGFVMDSISNLRQIPC